MATFRLRVYPMRAVTAALLVLSLQQLSSLFFTVGFQVSHSRRPARPARVTTTTTTTTATALHQPPCRRQSRRCSVHSCDKDGGDGGGGVDDDHNNNNNVRCSSSSIAQQWIDGFSTALSSATGQPDAPSSIADHFVTTKTPFWRDHLAFTWNLITLEGHDAIAQFGSATQHPSMSETTHWKLDPNKDMIVQLPNHAMEFWATFDTRSGRGRAHVRLEQEDAEEGGGVWKAFTLLTVLSSLTDRPWTVAPHHRRSSVGGGLHSRDHHSPVLNRDYFQSRRYEPATGLCNEDEADSKRHSTTTYVCIVGGGQAGLSLAARLHQLDIPYIVFESGESPGSSWRQRYPSLCLHDPAYYNHMPYLPFPKTWPLFCPRDKIASWMELYADALDLTVRVNSRVERAVRDGNEKCWSIDIVQRDPATTNGQSTYTISANHLVFCTGNSSSPRLPKVLQNKFNGLQLHSSQYKGGKMYTNRGIRRAVVVGANNSAFDIAQDLWEQLKDKGLHAITMIQRTPAMIVSSESVLTHGLGPLYSETASVPHEEADLVATTVPYKLALEKWKVATKAMAKTDEELLKGVVKAGYRLDNGPDGTGIFAKSATEGGGFYINVGCANLVAQGEVSVKYATVERLEEDGIVVKHKDDGHVETLKADLVVFATGFHTMDEYVSRICGKEIADAVGRNWGLGLGHKSKDPGPWEGELRNMWKPTNVDSLWLQGGNLAQNRHYSRYLALQLAARFMDVETNVYGIPPATPIDATS